jgi:hypothetical protein
LHVAGVDHIVVLRKGDTGGMTISQGTYVPDHGRLGHFAVLLVPGLDAVGAPVCSAVFSQLVSSRVQLPPVLLH